MHAAHVGRGGKGIKCDDREAIPLCYFHHIVEQHNTSKERFESRYGVVLKSLALDYHQRYTKERECMNERGSTSASSVSVKRANRGTSRTTSRTTSAGSIEMSSGPLQTTITSGSDRSTVYESKIAQAMSNHWETDRHRFFRRDALAMVCNECSKIVWSVSDAED